MPQRIKQRWFKIQGASKAFGITKALQRSNISVQDFNKYWKAVRDYIPDKELDSLFVKAFGVRNNITARMDFIKDILRRYKAMGEPVCAHNHNYLMNISVAHHILHKHIQEASVKCKRKELYMPRRIQQKWIKSYGKKRSFGLTKALKMSSITAQDFTKCWKVAEPYIPDKELYSLFVKGFAVPDNLAGKVNFIKDILRRYKAMGESVCLFAMPVFCLSAP